MDTTTSKYDVSKIDADRYWELVRKTLEDVFFKDPDSVKPLESDVRSSSPDEQILFYHLEPLSTAAEIAEAIPIPSQIVDYKKLRSRIYNIPYVP